MWSFPPDPIFSESPAVPVASHVYMMGGAARAPYFPPYHTNVWQNPTPEPLKLDLESTGDQSMASGDAGFEIEQVRSLYKREAHVRKQRHGHEMMMLCQAYETQFRRLKASHDSIRWKEIQFHQSSRADVEFEKSYEKHIQRRVNDSRIECKRGTGLIIERFLWNFELLGEIFGYLPSSCLLCSISRVCWEFYYIVRQSTLFGVTISNSIASLHSPGPILRYLEGFQRLSGLHVNLSRSLVHTLFEAETMSDLVQLLRRSRLRALTLRLRRQDPREKSEDKGVYDELISVIGEIRSLHFLETDAPEVLSVLDSNRFPHLQDLVAVIGPRAITTYRGSDYQQPKQDDDDDSSSSSITTPTTMADDEILPFEQVLYFLKTSDVKKLKIVQKTGRKAIPRVLFLRLIDTIIECQETLEELSLNVRLVQPEDVKVVPVSVSQWPFHRLSSWMKESSQQQQLSQEERRQRRGTGTGTCCRLRKIGLSIRTLGSFNDLFASVAAGVLSCPFLRELVLRVGRRANPAQVGFLLKRLSDSRSRAPKSVVLEFSDDSVATPFFQGLVKSLTSGFQSETVSLLSLTFKSLVSFSVNAVKSALSLLRQIRAKKLRIGTLSFESGAVSILRALRWNTDIESVFIGVSRELHPSEKFYIALSKVLEIAGVRNSLKSLVCEYDPRHLAIHPRDLTTCPCVPEQFERKVLRALEMSQEVRELNVCLFRPIFRQVLQNRFDRVQQEFVRGLEYRRRRSGDPDRLSTKRRRLGGRC